jgi:membrane protease YdiL (CAAX protease family)
MVYLSRPLDYLWAFMMVIGVFITIGILLSIDLPSFMNWSWTSLLSDGEHSGNIMAAPLKSKSISIIASFWLILSLALPYLAKSEEVAFRSFVFGIKNRIKKSIKFGLIHMIVGVPLSIALLLAIVGYIFSIIYVRAFEKAAKSITNPDEVAINIATSIHAKYNFLIITIGALAMTLIILNS